MGAARVSTAPARALLVLAAGLAALVAAPPSRAAPPPNDNYLASTTINRPDGSLPRRFAERLDTSEATTQADTFDPNRDGVPFGGGKPEPTSCPAGSGFGRTVWYDFLPPTAGGFRIATAGFDSVVAVYEWNRATSQLGRLVTCQNASPGVTEEVLLGAQVRRGRNYTIQLGGAGGVGGPLDFTFEYFPDSDGDGVLDEAPDKCRTLRGIAAFGGCPPLVRGTARVRFAGVAGGVRVTSLFVDRADRGEVIEVRCRRCGPSVRRRAPRGGSVRLSGFVGRVVASGDRIEVRISRPKSRSGRFRFGAIGKVVTWPVTGVGLGDSTLRCTRPGSSRRIRCP